MAALAPAASVSAANTSAFFGGERLSASRVSSAVPAVAGLPALRPLRVHANSNKKPPAKPGKSTAKGAQFLIGYKGSNQAGSAPKTRDGKPGRVFKLSGENVDEYSPIFDPSLWSSGGGTYAPGKLGLALWVVTFVGVLGFGLSAIYLTSSLS